jgi:CRP-like cAMP-binding protein
VSEVALEPSSVMRIPRQLFMKMLESDPTAASRMRDSLAARVHQIAGEFSRVRSALAPARK